MKIATLILLATSTVFAATSVYLTQRARADSSAALEVAAERTRLSARVKQLEQERAALESEVQSLRGAGMATIASTTTAPALLASRPAAGEGPFSVSASRVSGVMHSLSGVPPLPPSPAMRKIMRNQMRQGLKRAYEDVGTELSLTAEQSSRLIDLLADQSGGFEVQERRRNQEAQLAAVIGAEKVPQFKEFQNSLGVRSELMQLQEQLSAADVPLSADQRKTLLAAVLEDQRRYERPAFREGATSDDVRAQMEAWEGDRQQRLHDSAQTVLSLDQMDVLDAYQQYHRDMRQQFRMALPTLMPDGSAGVSVVAESVAPLGATAVLELADRTP